MSWNVTFGVEWDISAGVVVRLWATWPRDWSSFVGMGKRCVSVPKCPYQLWGPSCILPN